MNFNEPIAIVDLSEEQIQFMNKIYNSVKHTKNLNIEKGFIYDKIDYQELKEKMLARSAQNNLGRVFFKRNKENKIIGFLLSFDSLNLPLPEQYPISFISFFLKHEWKFIKDLANIGHFCFMSQVIVSDGNRNTGIGKELLNDYLNFYDKAKQVRFEYTNSQIKKILVELKIITDKQKNEVDELKIKFLINQSEKLAKRKRALDKINILPYPILSGGVAHEQQYLMIKLLSNPALKVLFIDYYIEKSNNDLWFRTVKILRRDRFYDTIKTVQKTFQTVIPIQLNLTTNSINKLLEPLGAKVIWSSFFQFEDTLLSKDINLDKFYNGFYDPILQSLKGDIKEYKRSIITLKKILHYLSLKDRLSKESVASLSPRLKKSGFNFFLLDTVKEKYDLTDFANPVIENLNSLKVLDLLKNKNLGLGDGFNNEERKLWMRYLHFKFITEGSRPFPIDEEDIQKCETWKKEKLISEKEWEQLGSLIRKRFNQAHKIEPHEMEIIKEITSRRILKEQDAIQWQNWIELHKSMYKTDKSCMNKNQKWCHAVIPMSYVEGVSGVMFTLVFDPNKVEDNDWLNHLALNISNSFSKNMFNVIVRLLKTKMRRTLLKHAIASISTRNLAHHFGSHILSKLSSPKNLEKFIDVDEKGIASTGDLSSFFVYLRTRMDFLADISTSEPVTSISRKLNDEILAVFRNEDVVTSFISGSQIEDIEIDFINTEHKNSNKDIIIQLPNGNLGAHAIYIIFENIIRNSVKHSKRSIPEGILKLTVKVQRNNKLDTSQRGYSIVVYDNVLKSKADIKKLINEIHQKYIGAKIIEDNKKIRARGWGIGEMKMATAYLRKKVPSEYLDNEETKPPLLKVVFVPKNKKNLNEGFLGFEFYLKKPRKLLILDSSGLLTNFSNRQEWKNKGVKVLTKVEIEDDFYTQIHSHDIMVLFDDISRKEFEKFKNFPLRWITIKNRAEQIKIKEWLEKDIEEAFVNMWERWVKQYLQNKELGQKLYPFLRNDIDENEQLKQLDQELTRIDPKKILLFDLHGKAAEEGLVTPKQLGFYEACPTGSPTGQIINDNIRLSKMEKNRLHWELIEAACTNIIVIDERIQNEVANKEPSIVIPNTDYFDVLDWMNIHIPRIEDVNLYKDDLTEADKTALANWLEQFLTKTKIDFCVIHLGIIEKIAGTTLSEIKGYLDKIISKIDDRPEIVLISGRGKPHEMPLNTLFLNYSNIAKFILEERSKFHLCKILFSARTRLEGYDI